MNIYMRGRISTIFCRSKGRSKTYSPKDLGKSHDVAPTFTSKSVEGKRRKRKKQDTKEVDNTYKDSEDAAHCLIELD